MPANYKIIIIVILIYQMTNFEQNLKLEIILEHSR